MLSTAASASALTLASERKLLAASSASGPGNWASAPSTRRLSSGLDAMPATARRSPTTESGRRLVSSVSMRMSAWIASRRCVSSFDSLATCITSS